MSAIEWTDKTWNPVRGCNKVSPGCKYCYAERLMNDPWLRSKAFNNQKFSQVKLIHKQILGGWRKPATIFVCSMSDLFHKDVPFDYVDLVFNKMEAHPHMRFMVLTKRPARMCHYLSNRVGLPNDEKITPDTHWWDRFGHIWCGTSIENNKYLYRMKIIHDMPMPRKFVSIEPLLDRLTLLELPITGYQDAMARLDMVIVGGESGPKCRPMEKCWVTNIRDIAIDLGVGFFFKQWGGRKPKAGGRSLDGKIWNGGVIDGKVVPDADFRQHPKHREVPYNGRNY